MLKKSDQTDLIGSSRSNFNRKSPDAVSPLNKSFGKNKNSYTFSVENKDLNYKNISDKKEICVLTENIPDEIHTKKKDKNLENIPESENTIEVLSLLGDTLNNSKKIANIVQKPKKKETESNQIWSFRNIDDIQVIPNDTIQN